MKRFAFDKSTNTTIKNGSPIMFEQFLNLNSFLSPDASIPKTSQSTNDIYYRLIAIIIHMGPSPNEGHYITYSSCTNNIHDNWQKKCLD